MNPDPNATPNGPFEPQHPTLTALAPLALWIAILSLPMLAGNFLATELNDQYSSGYAYRAWAAELWKELGHFPLWNPEIFAGMPFVAGMHGDLFYPTAWLRLILPTHVAMNLGFVVHYVLAGLFVYLFLRALRVSWTGSVVGGLAYQLAGLIGSYVSPGHDGKLFVTTMLPLGFLGLTWALRDRRWEGYGVLALAVGLAMLSPHPQMAQYFLVAAAVYTLYLLFNETADRSPGPRVAAAALALGAVTVGVGMSAIQYLPFAAYIPYSPRDESIIRDFAWSASYGVPWEHLPELVLSRFTGESFVDPRTYWGSNGFKLHSEYLGAAVVGLAVLGVARGQRRRLVYWFGAIGLLFLLIALGSETPFYRLWWEVVPFARSMRAPGMAMYVVAFVIACLASFGVEALESGRGRRLAVGATVAGGVVVLLGAAGLFGAIATNLGEGVELSTGFPGRSFAEAGRSTIGLGAMASGLALAGMGVAAWGRLQGRVGAAAFSVALVAVVGTDLWFNARPFWNYSRAHETLFAPDDVKAFLTERDAPMRVWNAGVYPGAALMADRIAQWYGHHGNELHAFDVLNGRDGQNLRFRNAGHPQLLELFAIRYIVAPAQGAPDSLPGYRRVLEPTATSAGPRAVVFERSDGAPYARLVPAAAKVEFNQAVATVLDQRFPADRVVLLDGSTDHEPSPVGNQLPEPIVTEITFDLWEPGHMRINLGAGAPRDGYLVISENHYPDWRAVVDGEPAPVMRGNGTLLTVPVAPGSRVVELTFVSSEYRTGKLVSLVSTALVLLGLITPGLWRRRGG